MRIPVGRGYLRNHHLGEIKQRYKKEQLLFLTFWYSEKNLRTDYLNRIKEIEICVRHVDRVWKA